MKNRIKNFSFPYKTAILILSPIVLFIPMFIIAILPLEQITRLPKNFGHITIFFSSLLGTMGFIYCTLGYHFQILRGDELKLKIHLESLNVAFITMLISLFLLIFIFLNFAPTMLNYILVILAVVGIIAYVLGMEFIKEKYE